MKYTRLEGEAEVIAHWKEILTNTPYGEDKWWLDKQDFKNFQPVKCEKEQQHKFEKTMGSLLLPFAKLFELHTSVLI